MGYYQGDFYQGDFYAGAQGDPGIFSFLGKIAKAAVGFVPGVGPVASKALSVIGRPGGGALTRMATAGALARRAGGAIMRHKGIAALGGGSLAAAGAAALMRGGRGGMRGAPGGRRRRRMRVTNPRALRRAIRRAHGFARFARKVLHFTSPRAPRGRAIFRVRRRPGARLKA